MSRRAGRHHHNSILHEPLPGFEHVLRFYDPRYSRILAKILPGEYYLTNAPNEIIVTTLGSCVSACIRDPKSGLGGMNHFMLPGVADQAGQSLSRVSTANCYGVFAMENLITEILKYGGQHDRLEIKITGGGRIGWGSGTVGDSNAQFIQTFLEVEGFHPIVTDLGGSHPRKVQYYPLSGKLRIKKLAALTATTVIKEEVLYQQQILQRPMTGTVEIF